MKKVCIITPSLNRACFLSECINSVQKLITLGKFEIEHIIIDDGSTDNTKEVLHKINYPNLKKIFLPENVGISKARNLAAKQTNADYIYFFDSDDFLTQNSIRYLIESAETKSYKCVYGDAIQVNEKTEYLPGKDYFGWEFNDTQTLLKSMFEGYHLFLPTGLFETNTYLKVGGYREDLKTHEMADFYIRLAIKNILPHHISATVLIRRLHSSNVSLDYFVTPLNELRDRKKLFKLYLPELSKIMQRDYIESITKKFSETQ